jgi:ribonuclease HI
MQELKVFTDGGSRGNPGPAAAGIVIEGLAGKKRILCGKYLGEATNNVAEYSAVILAYEILLKEVNPNQTQVKFFMDSLLVAKQLSGDYKVKNSNLELLFKKIKTYEGKFVKVSYEHVRREFNKLADREVNRVLDEI